MPLEHNKEAYKSCKKDENIKFNISKLLILDKKVEYKKF